MFRIQTAIIQYCLSPCVGLEKVKYCLEVSLKYHFFIFSSNVHLFLRVNVAKQLAGPCQVVMNQLHIMWSTVNDTQAQKVGWFWLLFFEDGSISYLQCRWERVGIRKNALSVGALGCSINHGLSDQLLSPVKKQPLPYMVCWHFCNGE